MLLDLALFLHILVSLNVLITLYIFDALSLTKLFNFITAKMYQTPKLKGVMSPFNKNCYFLFYSTFSK